MKFLAEAMFPKAFTCDICGIETFGSNLCPDCAKTVELNDKITCPLCGRRVLHDGVCIECRDLPPLFDKAVSALVYNGGTQKLIAKFKNGSEYLKEYFADLICEKLKGFEPIDYILYVPMTAKAEAKRGYNQSKLLAESVSARTSTPVAYGVIVKSKETPAQKTLNRAERTDNLNSCFTVNDRKLLKGKSILLTDDVLTTGATADAMTKKLKTAGAAKVFFATVASVEYKQKP